jgi:hypothetical protein
MIKKVISIYQKTSDFTEKINKLNKLQREKELFSISCHSQVTSLQCLVLLNRQRRVITRHGRSRSQTNAKYYSTHR